MKTVEVNLGFSLNSRICFVPSLILIDFFSQNISGCVKPPRKGDDAAVGVGRNVGDVVAEFAGRGCPDVALQTLNVSRNR